MSDQAACENCQFFTPDGKPVGGRWGRFVGSGHCHRYPPTLYYRAEPVVLTTDWCGEFQAKAPAPCDPAVIVPALATTAGS